jgi:hypothetical protein
MSTYGNVHNYSTNDIIRPATRADWLRGQRDGERHTGAHRSDEFGDTVYVDGPEEDPEPWLPLIRTIVDGATASLERGATVGDEFAAASDDLWRRTKPSCMGGDERDCEAWEEACVLAARVDDMCESHGSVRAWLEDHERRAQDDDRLCRTVEVESDLLRDLANLAEYLRHRGA